MKLKLVKVIPKKLNCGKEQSLFLVFIIILLSSSMLVASRPDVVVHSKIFFIKPYSMPL